MKKHAYSYLGEQGNRIQKILNNISPDDDWQNTEAWGTHLEKVLRFPFAAEVWKAEGYGPLEEGEKVKIDEVVHIDDLYGVIVKVRKGREIFHYPLCELEVCEKKSSNYEHIDDYQVWFANR